MTTQVYLCPTLGVGYQAFTSSGLPLNAGLIYTYIAGGTTPQATYTDNLGAVLNANPIVLDADGRMPSEVWLLAGQSYRFDIKDSLGNLLKSYDNVYGIGDPGAPNQGSQYYPLTGAAGTNTITASAGKALTALAAGQLFVLVPGTTSTGPATLNITPSGGSALGAKNILTNAQALVGGELVASAPTVLEYDGTQFNIVNSAPFVDSRPLIVGSSDATKKLRFEVDGNTTAVTRVGTVPNSDFNLGMPRSYLAGLTMSTAGSSATMSIAAGAARDSTNAADMVLASSISKTTSAWTVGTGNGGLDTGAIANSTWYHFYEIMRPDTGVVDVLFSTSVSSPTLPSNYVYFRRIGSGRTNGSAQWTSFIQDGDYFRWLASVLDVNTTNPGNSAVSATLTVPTGVNVFAILNSARVDSGAAGYIYISDLATNDEAPSNSAAPLATYGNNAAGDQNAGNTITRTNTSAQVRYRLNSTNSSTVITIATLGWFDRRGRDA